MSTKIYNGYKIKNLNALELKEFIKELQERVQIIYKEKFFKTFCIDMVDTLDDLTVLDAKYKETKDATEIEKYLIKLYKVQEPMSRVVSSYFVDTKQDLSMDKILNWFDSYCGSSVEVFLNKINLFNDRVKITNKRQPAYDFQSEICVYPMQDKILFQAWGEVDSLLEKICLSRKKVDKEFRKKYELTYYGYWNNVDKPNNVTKKEWLQRFTDWDIALPGLGVPVENGLVVDILNSESFFTNIHLGMITKGKKFFDICIPSFDIRVEASAISYCKKTFFEKYCKENGIEKAFASDVLDATSIFKEKLDNSDEELLKEIEEQKEHFSNILLPISKDTLLESILTYCPNYYNDYKKSKGKE